MIAMWTLIGVPTMFLLVLAFGNRSVTEAAGLAVAMISLGFPFLGAMWVHPLSQLAPVTRKTVAVAFLWMLLTLVPVVALWTVLERLVSSRS